ncbi:MAG: RNA-binding domain-containing protein [Candidatus Bathyarchaeia archaeon]
MKSGQAIQTVEISTIAHATDDLDKVQTAVTRLIPDTLKGRQLFTRQYLQGHYGNPIITFEARLTKQSVVDEFATFFLNQLSNKDKLVIQRDLRLCSDAEGNLYIRIDKQQIFRGFVQLGEEDPIRVRMKFTRFIGQATDQMIKYLGV